MKKLLVILLSFVLALPLVGCSKDSETITVGATSRPHAEILEAIKSDFEKSGYKLKIKEFDKYELINSATENNEIDANFFQHKPFLDDYNAKNNGTLIPVASVHFEPLGIYSRTGYTLESVKSASGKKVLVPDDKSNEARALLLLEENGLITLREGAGLNAAKADIIANPYNLDVREVAAELIAEMSKDESCALGVINGNYALAAGLKTSDALAGEDVGGQAAKTYANVLVVRSARKDEPWVEELVKCLLSEKVKNFVAENYGGAVKVVFD